MITSRSRRYNFDFVIRALAVFLSSHASAQSSSPSENRAEEDARALFEQGTVAFKGGLFRRALVLYEDAYARSPTARMLYNIGVAAESDHQTGRAIAAYDAYIKSAPVVDKGDDVQRRITTLSASKTPTANERRPVEHQGLMEQARRARSAGENDRAWRLYRSADELYPNARTLLGLGATELNLRRYRVSVFHLEAALRTAEDALDGNLAAEAERLKSMGEQQQPVEPIAPRARTGSGAADDGVASAVALYQRACDGGSLDGCTSLGVNYTAGLGVGQDYVRARELFAIACDGGELRGCTNLGTVYEKGWGIPRDYSRAYSLHRRACDGKNALGCVNLAGLFDAGFGVNKDYTKAAAIYTTACDLGDQIGCAELGRMFENGRGVEVDMRRAADLYTRACESNALYGCAKLGFAYGAGHGVPQDYVRAALLSDKACQGGQMLGCYNLGVFKEYGKGGQKDMQHALELYTRACDGGFMPACTSAGNLKMQLADADGKQRPH